MTADVTTRLGEQVREALQILLEGFEAAEQRDGAAVLREATGQAGERVHEGLLIVMLRLIFALHAEDRGLLPVEHPVYAGQLSVRGLYAALVADADAYGDTMEQRFGAWPRLIRLFRALHLGREYADPGGDPSGALSMPPLAGRLFDPGHHAFLEGGTETRLPSISDDVIHRVLGRLLVLDGQQLRYSALAEEQLGSAYEGLMGHTIERRADRLVIAPGEARRRTGSHYTPRSLAGPIVQRTLEPLLAAIRARIARERPGLADPQPGAEDLLGLKICDPAMGSGAFLMEACRFMATELVAAWVREGTLERELAAADDSGPGRDPESLARRLVARRCLFGVDKNPLAVELGKLSLWLLTRSRGEAFTFLDHRLKVGDSLVGLTRAQILAMDWRAAAPAPTVAAEPAQTGERLRDVADIVLSSYFFPHDRPDGLTPQFLARHEKVSDRARRACLARIRGELSGWLTRADSSPLPGALELRRALVRDHIRPMHWEIEFPEVFTDDRGEPRRIDAVVGNPPFAGKNAISDVNGPAYLTWLGAAYRPSHGNADLSAYFFRRADWLLGAHGTLGLIATNTIGQGDTRETGLQPLVAAGGRIYDATQDLKWPVKGASVSVSIVHMAKGAADHHGLRSRLDGEQVAAINSQLRPASERRDPVRLAANQGRSFVGSYLLGKGFVLTPGARDALVASDRRNGARIAPYMGGQEFNTSPRQAHERYVIDFADLSLSEAEQWPALLAIVRERVKPERERNNREGYRRYWWQYAERRAALYPAIRPLGRCLATSLTAKHRAFAFMPTTMVLDQTLIVTATESMAVFGLLQSRIHADWALKCGGAALELRPRYSPSRCFETFPFPDPPTLAAGAALEAASERLHDARAAYMVATDQGLTKTYNALSDPLHTEPAVLQLRRLHEQLDRAVLDAYGQPRIEVPPYTGATPEQRARFQDQILEFLFARNALLAISP